MTATDLTIAFDQGLPVARWAPLFHVFQVAQPDVHIDWRAIGFPQADRSLLEAADVAILLEPPFEAGLETLLVGSGSMSVLMAAGHPLAHRDELALADIVDEPFPNGPLLHPAWRAFWTLDERRSDPPRMIEGDVVDVASALKVVAEGRAIATMPAWASGGLPHPGIVALPLVDGPPVTTRLVWRADDQRANVQALVDTIRSLGGGARPPAALMPLG